MVSIKSHSNPFDLVKASDFSDEQIDKYWVDIGGEGGLHDLFEPLTLVPMLLLGGKGSGKTHLMRYYSSAVRKIHAGNDLARAVEMDGFLGIYVRADGLNVGRFAGKGESEDAWAAVFSYYFELWLATHFLRSVGELVSSDGALIDEEGFVIRAIGILSHCSESEVKKIDDLIRYFTSLRKDIDRIVGNVATGRSSLSQIDVCIAPGDLVFGLSEIFNEITDNFRKIIFVYLIDEIENFSASQQKFLNSLIRYRRGQVTFKIGCRLYGIRTKKTLGGSEEEIRQGAEYQKVVLDAWLRSHGDAYKQQAKGLIGGRLEAAGFRVGDVERAFACLDASDWYQKETLPLMGRWDENGKDRPYWSSLRKQLAAKFGEDLAHEVIAILKLDAFPVLEKANIYVFSKEWRSSRDLIELANSVASDANLVRQGRKSEASSYFLSLEHFKSDFLAQIFRECSSGRRVVYAGLDTLVHLSQGVPRNLLGLLKHIFRRAQFADEKPFESGSAISIKSQIEGVADASSWFWEDAQPDMHGNEVRFAVKSVAELLSAVRFSLKPAECDLSTFTVAAEAGTSQAKEVLEHAENWSYLIKVPGGGIDRNDGSTLNDKYQLSPMLVPRWGVSEYRRGTISLSEELFNSMFDPEHRRDLDKLLAKRLSGMRDPFLIEKGVGEQGSLI